MQKFRFQYQFEGKSLTKQFWSECQAVRYKKIKMAAKIQYGCQFPAFCRSTPNNVCTIQRKSWYWSLYTYVCTYE